MKRFIFTLTAMLVLTVTGFAQSIAEGVYVIKFTHDPDYVLTLKDGNASNANIVHLWKWKNDNSQKWKVTHKDGKIVIRSMVDNNYVLDALDYIYDNNTQIYVFTYHGGNNQLWVPEKLSNGSYIVKIAGNTKYCLDLYKGNAKNGGKIELYNAHKDWPEQWTFEKVSSTTSSTQKTTGTTSNTQKTGNTTSTTGSTQKTGNSNTTSGSTQNLKPNAPESMTDYQENIGKTYTFIVKGNINGGSIYGGKNNIYTSDSDLSVACVHAGILKDGSVGKVTVKVLADQGSYPSLTRNGITSGEWGAWRGAYQILADNGSSNSNANTTNTTKNTGTTTTQKTSNTTSSTQKTATTSNTNSSTNAKPNAPQNMMDYMNNVGQTYTFTVKGDDQGMIWGGKNNVYTVDSDLATACVHAGLVKKGGVVKVKVKILGAQSEFPSVTRNGITSDEYSNYYACQIMSAESNK